MASAATPFAVSDECKQKVLELRAPGAKTQQSVIFKLDDGQKQVVVERLGNSYEDLRKALPGKECRFAAYLAELPAEDGTARSRVVLIEWSPDGAGFKSKMQYSNSKAGLQQALVGIHKVIQAADFSDLSELEPVSKE